MRSRSRRLFSTSLRIVSLGSTFEPSYQQRLFPTLHRALPEIEGGLIVRLGFQVSDQGSVGSDLHPSGNRPVQRGSREDAGDRELIGGSNSAASARRVAAETDLIMDLLSGCDGIEPRNDTPDALPRIRGSCTGEVRRATVPC